MNHCAYMAVSAAIFVASASAEIDFVSMYGSRALERAATIVASEFENSAEAKRWFAKRLASEGVDYAPTLGVNQWVTILEGFGPPPVDEGIEFNVTSDLVWTGAADLGLPFQAAPVMLTYSFPDDDVPWGNPFRDNGPNVLNQRLLETFGSVERGREYVRQGLAAWSVASGITYKEVEDDNSPWNESVVPIDSRGDIRIGGAPAPASGAVAYNGFPSEHIEAGFTLLGGGDMFVNTSWFGTNNLLGTPLLSDASGDFVLFRGVMAHEHGHGLGFHHTFPADGTKVMETGSLRAGSFTLGGTGFDDWRGAGRNYGDHYAPLLNHSPENAVDFGDFTAPTDRARAERRLSTNGVFGPNNTDEDWYRFSLSETADVRLVVVPTGGVYIVSTDFTGSMLITVDATSAGDLGWELRDATGANVLASAVSGGPGEFEFEELIGVPAGEYTLRVFDQGPNPTVDQIVQLYDMSIRINGQALPPFAFAGIDKRVEVGVECYFMGDFFSFANETGAQLSESSYDWDLDGDGLFETLGMSQVSTAYDEAGEVPVTLRVTDSFGMSATHTVYVDVFSSMAGSGADLNGDGLVNGADLAALLSVWGSDGQGTGADINTDGIVDGADLADLLSNWTP